MVDSIEITDQKPKTNPTPKNRKKVKFLRDIRNSVGGWLFVLPAVILMGIFTFYPIVASFVYAFMEKLEYGTHGTPTVGFENFRAIVMDKAGVGSFKFLRCLDNTLFFAIVSVPISTLLALLIAVALNSIKAVQRLYQTVLFLPYLTNALSMGAVFATFFSVIGTRPQILKHKASYGLVNDVLMFFGGPDAWVNWLTTGHVWENRFVVVLYSIWSGLPFKILILFSALQTVNKQYYDAAKIDGATRSTTLWKVTVPLISPMISYLLVTGMMGGLKVYSSVVGIFGSDMNLGQMGTIVGYIYACINYNKTGYAAAGSLILFGIIMIFTAIHLYVSKKKVHY